MKTVGVNHPATLKILALGDVADASEIHLGDDAMLLGLARSEAFTCRAVAMTIVAGRPEAAESLFRAAAIRRPRIRRGQAHRDERNEQVELFVKQVLGPARNLRGDGAWTRLAAALQRSDAALVSGGGNLNSTWDDHIALRLALVRGARALGKPIVVSGQSVGPHLDPEDRDALTEIIESSDWFGVRERPSLELAADLAPRTTIHLGIDDAMFLDEDTYRGDGRDIATLDRFPGGGHRADGYVCATFDAGSITDSGVAVVAAELGEVAERFRLGVVFTPHLERLGNETSSSAVDDVRRAFEIGALLPRAVPWTVAPVAIDDAIDVARNAAIVVSSRFHPCVFGLRAGVASVTISQDGYTSTKCSGLLDLVGLDGWNVPSVAVGTHMLVDAADEAFGRRDEIRRHLEPIVDRWRLHSAGRFSAMLDVLGGGQAIAIPAPEAGARVAPSAAWAPVAALTTTQAIALDTASRHRDSTASATARYVADLRDHLRTAQAATMEATEAADTSSAELTRVHLAFATEQAARLAAEAAACDARRSMDEQMLLIQADNAELHERLLEAQMYVAHVDGYAAAQRVAHGEFVRRMEERMSEARSAVERVGAAEAELQALQATKTFRLLRRPRTLYARLLSFRPARRPRR